MDLTYVVADLLTDETLDQLPLDVSSFELKTRGYGALQASLSLALDDAAARDLPNLLIPARRAVYVYRGDQVLWGGILWRLSRKQSEHRVQLQAAEFESYFTRRLWTTDYLPTQVDQFEIARTLVGLAARALRLNLDDVQSGVLRDRTTEYLAKDLHTVDQLLVDLSQVEDGFDYAIRTIDELGSRTRLLLLGYPTLGRRFEDSGLVFDSSLVDWSHDEDGLSSATEQWEIGAQVGTPEAPLITYARDDAALAAGFPLLQSVSQDHSSVSLLDSLDAYARADLAASPVPTVTHTCVVRADGRSSSDPMAPPGGPALGDFAPGDEALFVVDDDWYGTRAQGRGYSEVLRILSMQVDPKAGLISMALGPRLNGQNWKDPVPIASRWADRFRRLEQLARSAQNR